MKIVLNHKNIKIAALLLFVLFAIFNLFQFSVSTAGVDSGFFLSISRDWVNLGRKPGIDTFTGYTTIGYLYYALPFVFIETPSIEVFLLLNLLLFFLTFLIFFNTINSIFENKQIVLIILFSFLYNLNSITTDIKLENLILFYNVCIIFIISKTHSKLLSNEDQSLFYGILLGIFSALSFLTKQYGGLSLLFIILILEVLNIPNKHKIYFRLITTFLVIILFYISLQLHYGLQLNSILKQILGKMSINCIGASYGERKLSNLLVSLKYYKFEIVLLVGLIIGLLSVFKQNTNSKRIIKFVIMLLFIFLAQMPFYFQVFPHYKIFGLPFLLFLSIIYIQQNKNLNFENSKKVAFLNNVILSGYLLLSCFSFWSWGKNYNQRSLEKKISLNFQKDVAKLLPQKSKVFMLSSRKHWFSNCFSTPVPKTISYGFVGLDCLQQAVYQEKPQSFWIAGKNKIIINNKFNGYVIVDSVMIIKGMNKLYAIRLNRLNSK